MKRFKFKLLAVLAILVASVVVFVSSLREPPEPEYNGVKLSAWLEGFDYVGSSMGASHAAGVVQTMGTNCIPFLLRQIRSKDSRTRHLLETLLGKQSIIKIRFIPAQKLQRTAGDGFRALGSRGEQAIPELARLATDPAHSFGATRALSGISAKAVPALLHSLTNRNAHVRACTASALGYGFETTNYTWRKTVPLGGDADPKPVIAALILSTSDTDAMVRRSALNALGKIAQEPERVVPLLVQKLQTDINCRLETLQALHAFGREARMAIPAVLGVVGNSDAYFRRLALYTIRAIAQDHELAVPVLIQELRSGDTQCRQEAALALGEYGREARPAVPSLLIATKDVDERVRNHAGEALKKIAPE